MNFMRSIFLATSLILFSSTAFANVWTLPGETFWQGTKRDIESPVTTPASRVLWPGLGVEAVLLLTHAQFSQKIQPHIAETQPLGTTSNFGNYMGKLIPNVLYAGGMLADYELTGSSLALERSILMVKATLYSGVFTDLLKPIVRERRPNGSPDLASFPSGHSTVAFAFASIVGAEHAWYYGVGAYALASFVAFSRMNDNKHYLHDVTAGALIGTTYGLGVYYRQNESALKHVSKSLTIIPIVTPDVSYVQVGYEF